MIGKSVTLSGYPTDHLYYQYRSVGEIGGCNVSLVSYLLDMKKGQSGAPLYEVNNNGTYILAINIQETSSLNVGRRITQDMIDEMLKYI